MRISIFNKIFVSQLALIVTASGVISMGSYFFMVRLYNESQNEMLRVLSSATAMKIAAHVARHKTTIREIAEAREISLYAQKYQELLLGKHLARFQDQFPNIAYINKEGDQEFRLVNGHATEASENLADQAVFRNALAAPNQGILGEVGLDPTLQTYTVQFAYARIDYFGDQFLGLILGKASLSHVTEPACVSASLRSGYCLVVARDGKILNDPEPKNILKPLVIKNQSLDQLFRKAAVEPKGQIYHAVLNGENSYFVVSLVPGTPWLTMSVLPSQQYTEVPGVFRNFSLLLFLGLLILASIFTFFLAQSIIAPIRRLVLASTAMAKGDFEQRVDAGNDEVGDLANAFNTMAQQLGIAKNREQQILAAEASARLKAELADQHKTEFLSKISHELRTPLNAILGMTELLQDDKQPAEAQGKITTIKEAGQNLLQLIDGILDFSRLENGTMSLTAAPFDLYDAIARMKKKYAPIAEAKGLAFFCEETVLVPTWVVGDENRICQVLDNLLDNAIKFTEHGDVSLRVRPVGLKADNDQHIIHLRFEVADTGCGIPLEQQTAMFESFKQFESYATRQIGGLGLGLTLSNQLVELMHGKIGMKSAPSKGSTFFVDIDLPVAKQGSSPASLTESTQVTIDGARDQHSARKAMNILVAEDNPVNQKLLRLMLEMHGHHVLVTVDGKEAVAVYQSEAIDLVLMDVQMPGMNGFEATATIRDIEKTSGKHVPIIAVTAHVMPGYKEECLNAGMDNYLAKPFRMQELFAIIEETLAALNTPT